MRVSFVSGSFPPVLCGIGDYLQQLTGSLMEKGTVVDIITSRSEIKPVSKDGFSVRPVVPGWHLAALPLIMKELRNAAPDIVNLQYPTQRYGRQPLVNLLPIFIRAIMHIPVVTTIHEFSTYRRLGRLRVGLSVFASSQVIVPDQANLEKIRQAYPRSAAKLHHVPLGPNIEPQLEADFDRARQRAGYGFSQSDTIIAYFGFISPSKGIETLLKAYKSILDTRPDCAIHLLLIANRQPAEQNYSSYHRQVETLLNELSLTSRVTWTGYLPPKGVSACLASADLAVLPFRDGASLRRTTLLSALAHGLPVISTQDPDTPADKLNETHGIWLINVGDERALASAIHSLAENIQLRKDMAVRAVQFARFFAWERIASQTIEVYDLALRGRV